MISVSDCVNRLQASDGDDVTDAPGQVGGTKDEAQQEAEAEQPTEPEASTEIQENKDAAETMEGDLPADTVGGRTLRIFTRTDRS